MKIYSKNKIKKPDIIIFDIDDTLYSTSKPHSIGLNASFDFLKIITNLTKESIKKIYQESRKEIKLILGNTAASHSRLLYFQRFLETIKHGDVIKDALQCEQIYWSTYLDNIVIDSNLEKVFQELQEKNIGIAIATDLTANIQMKKLIKLNISTFIDVLVTSEESGQDKPNFDCFSLINEKINPQFKLLNYWMVGDSIIKDLKGAKIELNATTFQMKKYINNDIQNSECVDLSISDINQILDYL